MNSRTIDLGYRAREPFIAYHQRSQRWSCLVVHRRGGKTVACLMDLIDSALRCQKSHGRFAYVAPFYAQAKDVAWSYVKTFLGPIPGHKSLDGELRVELPTGSEIRLYGADNYDRMRGVYFDGVVLDEYGDMDPRAWPYVIRPALSDRKGWATFIGTPKGRNAFHQLWREASSDPAWFTMMLRASESGLLDADELADAKRMLSDDQYAQEYECSFDAAIVGAYFGKEMQDIEATGRITAVPYDPNLPVHTGWDLGVDDATAVWFIQIAGREVRVIDYLESHDGLTEVARELLAKPYVYGSHYTPHDMDIREITTAQSRKATLHSLGLRDIRVGKRVGPAERIHATRQLLPRCVFDRTATDFGVEVLKHYHREFDERAKTFRQTPKHDWASHGADAFGEMALGLVEPGLVRAQRRIPQRRYA